jgi:hypothetical protein
VMTRLCGELFQDPGESPRVRTACRAHTRLWSTLPARSISWIAATSARVARYALRCLLKPAGLYWRGPLCVSPVRSRFPAIRERTRSSLFSRSPLARMVSVARSSSSNLKLLTRLTIQLPMKARAHPPTALSVTSFAFVRLAHPRRRTSPPSVNSGPARAIHHLYRLQMILVSRHVLENSRRA